MHLSIFNSGYNYFGARCGRHGQWESGATKHRIGYIGCIGHIGVQIMLLLDMTQYKVVKGKRLGSVLVK